MSFCLYAYGLMMCHWCNTVVTQNFQVDNFLRSHIFVFHCRYCMNLCRWLDQVPWCPQRLYAMMVDMLSTTRMKTIAKQTLPSPQLSLPVMLVLTVFPTSLYVSREILLFFSSPSIEDVDEDDDNYASIGSIGSEWCHDSFLINSSCWWEMTFKSSDASKHSPFIGSLTPDQYQ